MKVGFNGEVHFEINPVPNQESVSLNADMKFEQFEHCSARVAIQLLVQQNSYEQIRQLNTNFEVSTIRVPNYSGGQMKRKIQTLSEHLNCYATEEMNLINKNRRKCFE